MTWVFLLTLFIGSVVEPDGPGSGGELSCCCYYPECLVPYEDPADLPAHCLSPDCCE